MRLFSVTMIVLALFCTGCQKKEEPKTLTERESMKHHLRINNQGDIASLNPHIGLDLPCRIFQKALYEGLTRIDENDQPALALAERVELAEDKRSCTFHLRPSYWSNGEPLIADHFKKSWEAALRPDSSCLRSDLFYLIKNGYKVKMGELPMEELGIKVVDDHTLVIELEHPAPYLLELLANPIFSPLYVSEGEPSVVNGPFMIESYARGEKLVLKPNPLYWDKEGVYLEKIETSFVQDPSTAVLMFEKGELDWVGAPFTMLPMDYLKEAEQSDHFVSKPIAAIYSYSCNTEKPPMNSKKIRQALSVVLPRESLCEHVLLGESATKAILPPGITHLTESDFLPDNDLILAQKLFSEALVELNCTKEELPPLEITYSDIAGQKQLAMALQQIWEDAFGVKVNLVATEWNGFFTSLVSKQYQLAGCIWFSAYHDATYNLDNFRDPNNRMNVLGWTHPQFTTLLEQADQEGDLRTRADLLRQAELLIVEEMPMIPLYVHHSKYLVSDKIQGIRFSSIGQVDFKGLRFAQETIQR